jgi:hypothetical protein
MNPYIIETRFAVENLISIASHEEALLIQKTRELTEAEARLRVHDWDFRTSDMSDDFSDAYVMAAFNRMAAASQERDALQTQVANLQFQVGVHQASVQALHGGVLQIAKQGISIVHGGLPRAPIGRMVGSLPLKDIVWQGRNQSLHYEEGSFRPPLIAAFSTLEAEHGPDFSLTMHAGKNRATQVIKLLGWTSYGAYLADIQLLLP